MVSNLAFRIITNAIKIRLDRQEDTLENLINIYTKLSEKQKKELLEYFKDYQTQS